MADPLETLRVTIRSAADSLRDGQFVAGALRYPASWIAPGDTATAMSIPPRGTGLTTQQ